MIIPGVQKPHCRPWHSRNASCTGCSWPFVARPSIVVTSCAVGLDRQHVARLHAAAVEVDRARAAVAGVAADDGAGLAELLAQVLHEQHAGFDVVGDLRSVDGEADPGHGGSSSGRGPVTPAHARTRKVGGRLGAGHAGREARALRRGPSRSSERAPATRGRDASRDRAGDRGRPRSATARHACCRGCRHRLTARRDRAAAPVDARCPDVLGGTTASCPRTWSTSAARARSASLMVVVTDVVTGRPACSRPFVGVRLAGRLDSTYALEAPACWPAASPGLVRRTSWAAWSRWLPRVRGRRRAARTAGRRGRRRELLLVRLGGAARALGALPSARTRWLALVG